MMILLSLLGGFFCFCSHVLVEGWGLGACLLLFWYGFVAGAGGGWTLWSPHWHPGPVTLHLGFHEGELDFWTRLSGLSPLTWLQLGRSFFVHFLIDSFPCPTVKWSNASTSLRCEPAAFPSTTTPPPCRRSPVSPLPTLGCQFPSSGLWSLKIWAVTLNVIFFFTYELETWGWREGKLYASPFPAAGG